MFRMSHKFGSALRIAAVAVSAVSLAGITSGSASAEDKKLVILGSVPGLKFPFFVHMMNQIKAEGEKLGVEIVESDGQVSSTKQTSDVEAAIARKVDGIVISPNEVDAMAPALQEAVDAKIPVITIDRYVAKVPDLLGHVGADNSKGGEAQAELIMKMFPNGAKVMNLQGQPGAGPAIDRNKGLHAILDQHKDKYPIVFEQTAEFDRVKGLSVTEAALASMQTPPDVIVAANDDMILGAMEAVKAHNLSGKVALIGFDALPEALARVKDGSLTATVEQFPGLQSSKAVDKMVAFLRDGKAPEPKTELLTPITITKDNLDKAERLGEIQ
ncbi:substrate-binding domain-containing protein [Dongia sedimenti]|uniref:Substrate-binding domain-containing protein n=1 Tax=Dongia sedimenti TaxID=3064282 RepID=A0ABU0YS40_9PROT|nr:substrate-binding domain-containing protein [Rhodospirillaceae bacterium R-7]